MKFFKFASSFSNDEDGAVTVDRVVLTAAIVGLGIAVLAAVQGGLTTAPANLSGNLGENAETNTTTLPPAPE